MKKRKSILIISAFILGIIVILTVPNALYAVEAIAAPGSKLPPANENIVITEADVTVERVGTSIPVSEIGEPVSAVNLSAPQWIAGADAASSYAVVEGSMLPIDPEGFAINFRVVLPASWSRRAIQRGGGGNNGTITVQVPGGRGGFGGRGGMGGRGGGTSNQGIAMYGSDSGHQAGGGGRGGFGAQQAGGGNSGDAWGLNDEAIKNLGYMQMKKTHDAAMVIMERVYGERPRFNYYIGTSQGGREALTVAQRYPEDYDGIVANVPIVNFSSLMMAPEFIRIQEKPLANWVTPQKVTAIATEFIRQCDKLDGLADGIISNYIAARQLFDVTDGIGTTDPWAALRAPGGVDPNPDDTSASAKLTDGQIETLELVYSRYKFATPLANGVETFGMWVPNTDPSGSGLIERVRYRGQEGAAENAPMHSHLGVIGATGFLMQDLSANPLDYVEGGELNGRREEISQWLDSTNPDLSAFYQRGGKLIVTIGTNDTLASPGAQLDYYQSVIDKMGRDTVDAFARFYVVPQAGHGLSGRNYNVNGDGETVEVAAIPSQFDKEAMIIAWAERNEAPDKTLVISSGDRSLPVCSYPNYPKYVGGPVNEASSYVSTAP